VNGEGGKIGPDLSNLIHRDYASVMKDITQPSAAINPDHLAYNVQLRDGDVLNGIIVADGDKEMELGTSDGKTVHIAKSKIDAVKPSAISLMPENLLDTLTAQERKDLLTFLLTPSAAPKTAASK
jgi:putative heme-binding domain-containing protein